MTPMPKSGRKNHFNMQSTLGCVISHHASATANANMHVRTIIGMTYAMAAGSLTSYFESPADRSSVASLICCSASRNSATSFSTKSDNTLRYSIPSLAMESKSYPVSSINDGLAGQNPVWSRPTSSSRMGAAASPTNSSCSAISSPLAVRSCTSAFDCINVACIFSTCDSPLVTSKILNTTTQTAQTRKAIRTLRGRLYVEAIGSSYVPYVLDTGCTNPFPARNPT
mmetsp:Transcript_15745/g.45373  ORF Transcript_15745/g.45373 Transcript_15745/m.45373 type:complete len:226 (-) Transcript_15745:432-1109(-)